MRLIRWRRVRSSEDGLPFEPVVVTQAGRRKRAGAKEPSQRIRRIRELTMGVVKFSSSSTIENQLPGLRKRNRAAVLFVFLISFLYVDGTPCAMKVARTV